MTPKLNGENGANISRCNVSEGFGLDQILGKSAGFYTSVTIKDKHTGKILFQGHNQTVLGGRIALLEELFDITRNTSQHVTINQSLGITHSDTDTVLRSKTIKRSCLWFMAGKGAASTEVPGKYYTPKNYETKLYDAIPFRMVPEGNDLTASEREQYRLRKIVEVNGVNYVAYYAKAFDPGNVIIEYNKAEYTPQESDTVPVDENDSTHRLAGGSVLVYISFSLSIEPEELKEYFRIKNGTLEGAGMSEVGLVYAADRPNQNDGGRYELAAAELMAKMTSDNVSMARDTNARIMSYKCYAK